MFETLTTWLCEECGREDWDTPPDNYHFWRGKKCSGMFVKQKWIRKPAGNGKEDGR